MKKTSLSLFLALAALAVSADSRRVNYGGYRIGSSDVATDETRVSDLPVLIQPSEQGSSKKFAASKVNGQKIVKWWAYNSKSNVPATHTTPAHVAYNNSQDVAGSVYSMDWTYNTFAYSLAYLVVDYDWITYNLIYNANDGSGTLPSSLSGIIYTNNVTIASDSLPARTGYTWSGWTNNLTTTVWQGGETVTGESLGLKSIVDGSNVVLYAKWTPNTYTVTLDMQSGTGGSASVTATYGAAMPSITLPTRTGYTFGGYFTGTNGTGTQYYMSNGTSVRAWDKAAATTLYAKWTANTYNILFDNLFNYNKFRNSESCKVQASTCTIEFSNGWPLLTNTLDSGWVLTSYGATSGTTGYYAMSVTANTKYRFACIVDTLGSGTAWADCKAYYVAYDGSGNIIKNGTSDYRGIANCAYDGTYSSGGQFGKILGDFTTPAGCVSIQIVLAVDNGRQSARFINMSVYRYTPYALTSRSSHSRRFNQRYSDDSSATIGSCMTAANNTWPADPTRAGYTFKGWFNADGGGTTGGTGTQYTSSSKPVANNDLHLWSKWTANSYAVKFNANGGSGTMADESFTYDTAKTLTTNSFTRTGYTFAGWTTKADGTGTSYSDTQSVSNLTATAGGTVTLYAQWTANTYIVHKSPGYTGPTWSDTAATFGTAFSATAPTRTGYDFLGWKVTDGLDSSTAKYGATAAGATNSIASASTLCKNGEPSGTVCFLNLTPTDGGSATITAQWAATSYTVKFNANGGVGEMEDQTFCYDQGQALSKCAFTSSLMFMGWATNETDAAAYVDGEVVTNLTAEAGGEVNLYAVWDNGDLSKAMHCDNLVWISSGTSGTEWEAVEGSAQGYNGSGSAVTNSVSWPGGDENLTSKKLIVKPELAGSASGILSFRYKTSNVESWLYSLNIKNGASSEVAELSDDWNQYGPVFVNDISDVQILLQIFRIDDESESESCTVYIDQMKWVPGGAEPTEDDRPTINGFTAKDGGFTLSVDGGNISDLFSYQILATNELVKGDWPVRTNLTADAIKSGFDIVPEAGEPKMFYKVKVVPKQ